MGDSAVQFRVRFRFITVEVGDRWWESGYDLALQEADRTLHVYKENLSFNFVRLCTFDEIACRAGEKEPNVANGNMNELYGIKCLYCVMRKGFLVRSSRREHRASRELQWNHRFYVTLTYIAKRGELSLQVFIVPRRLWKNESQFTWCPRKSEKLVVLGKVNGDVS